MFSALLLVGKFILARSLDLLAFTIKHWRIIVPLLVLGYCLHLYFAQVKRADDAIEALNQRISATNAARAQREQESAEKDKASQIARARVLADHSVTLARLQLDRQRETKNLKDLYEKDIATVKRNWADRVRLDQARYTATGERQIQLATEGTASSWPDCNAAFDTLEQACTITTVDYNTLWTAWNKECQVKGCSDE